MMFMRRGVLNKTTDYKRDTRYDPVSRGRGIAILSLTFPWQAARDPIEGNGSA